MDKAIVIVGPTAIGKTKISIELAKRLNLEIISGDSVAVYKTLDIGSAKPTKEEMQGVKHHLIDICEPTCQYDVASFQRDAREILKKNHKAIICGGTGLYISSVIYNYEFEAPKRDENLNQKYSGLSNEELYLLLLKKDPNINKDKIHPNNRKRVLRALEILDTTNKGIEEYNKKREKVIDSYIVYLNLSDREALYDRINKRVDQMVEKGLVLEAKGLLDKNIYPNAIGYKELIPYFRNEISLDSAILEIKKNSRHLAKRQMTWFKNQMDTHFYEVNLEDISKTVDEILKDLIPFLEG